MVSLFLNNIYKSYILQSILQKTDFNFFIECQLKPSCSSRTHLFKGRPISTCEKKSCPFFWTKLIEHVCLSLRSPTRSCDHVSQHIWSSVSITPKPTTLCYHASKHIWECSSITPKPTKLFEHASQHIWTCVCISVKPAWLCDPASLIILLGDESPKALILCLPIRSNFGWLANLKDNFWQTS